MKNKIILILICVPLLFFAGCKRDYTTYKAKDGILDLQNWNYEKEPVISLEGNWEFYWNGLYSPEDIASLKPSYIDLPSTWNGKVIDGQTLAGIGFATYRLKILLPQNKHYPIFAIRMKPLTNCKVFINDLEFIKKEDFYITYTLEQSWVFCLMFKLFVVGMISF